MAGGAMRIGGMGGAVILGTLLLAAMTAGCGGTRQPPAQGPTPAAGGVGIAGGGVGSGGVGTPGETREEAAPATSGGFAVFVTPSSPSRIAPPSVSVQSPPGQGSEIREVEWFVNGTGTGTAASLSPSMFSRGDRIRAAVTLRAAGKEMHLATPEAVAANALPAITEVALEPRAPTAGCVVRANVQAGDPDGDPLKFRYVWYVDNVVVAGDGDSLTLKGVKRGSWVHVAVTPNDGFADGAWRYSPSHQVVNAPPVVKSSSPTTVPPSRILTHVIVAEDPDGDPLTYTLAKGPDGVTLSGATVTWKISESQLDAPAEIVIRISDDGGASTDLTLNLTPRRPQVPSARGEVSDRAGGVIGGGK